MLKIWNTLIPFVWPLLAISSFFIVMANESYWCLFAIMFAFASGHLMYDALTKKKIITNILSEKDTESFVLASSLRKEFDEYKEESLGREGLLKQQFIDTVSFYEGELKKLNIQIECLTVDAKLEKGTGFPEEPPSTDVKSEVVAYASTKKPKNTKAKAKV